MMYVVKAADIEATALRPLGTNALIAVVHRKVEQDRPVRLEPTDVDVEGHAAIGKPIRNHERLTQEGHSELQQPQFPTDATRLADCLLIASGQGWGALS